MINRRQFGSTIAGSTAALAGCVADLDDNGGGSDDGGGKDNDENDSNTSDETEDIVVAAALDVVVDGNEVTIAVTDMGNADHLLIRGDCTFSDDRLDESGDQTTQTCASGDTVTVVGVLDSGAQSTVDTFTV